MSTVATALVRRKVTPLTRPRTADGTTPRGVLEDRHPTAPETWGSRRSTAISTGRKSQALPADQGLVHLDPTRSRPGRISTDGSRYSIAHAVGTTRSPTT